MLAPGQQMSLGRGRMFEKPFEFSIGCLRIDWLARQSTEHIEHSQQVLVVVWIRAHQGLPWRTDSIFTANSTRWGRSHGERLHRRAIQRAEKQPAGLWPKCIAPLSQHRIGVLVDVPQVR